MSRETGAVAAVFAALVCGMPAAGQTIGKQAFEVASIRPENPNDPRSSVNYTNSAEFRSTTTVFPSNRLTIRHTQLKALICDAYDVDWDYISGPDWLEHHFWDLDAKAEGTTRLTRQQMQPMVQTLLEERFHLKAHHEHKFVAGFLLVPAKGGAKMPPNKGAPFQAMLGGFRIRGQNTCPWRISSNIFERQSGDLSSTEPD